MIVFIVVCFDRFLRNHRIYRHTKGKACKTFDEKRPSLLAVTTRVARLLKRMKYDSASFCLQQATAPAQTSALRCVVAATHRRCMGAFWWCVWQHRQRLPFFLLLLLELEPMVCSRRSSLLFFFVEVNRCALCFITVLFLAFCIDTRVCFIVDLSHLLSLGYIIVFPFFFFRKSSSGRTLTLVSEQQPI